MNFTRLMVNDRNLTRDEGGDEELQDEGEHPEHVPGRP